MKQREEKKKAQFAKVRKSLGSPVVRTRSGYPGTAKDSGSLGRAAKPGWDQDSSKGVLRNTRNKNIYIPISLPIMQKRTRKLGKQQFMSKGLVPRGTQNEEPWREVAGKTFNLVGRNQLTWEKWQEERQPKAKSKKGERPWRKKGQRSAV